MGGFTPTIWRVRSLKIATPSPTISFCIRREVRCPKSFFTAFGWTPEITVELYAYKAWWVTNNVGSGVSIEERYLMGTRFSTEDITLENLIDHSTGSKVPELNTVGNLVVFEVVDDVTTTDKF